MPMRRSRAPALPPSAASSASWSAPMPRPSRASSRYLRCFASDVLHCGGVGCGQVAKLMNNMVLFEIGGAIAEALAIGRHSGVEPEVLLEALSNGSADSFALRNHGRNAMLPGSYPERAFSTRYALKDLEYALALAAQAGIDAPGARLVRERFDARHRGRRRRALLAGDRRAHRAKGRRVVAVCLLRPSDVQGRRRV